MTPLLICAGRRTGNGGAWPAHRTSSTPTTIPAGRRSRETGRPPGSPIWRAALKRAGFDRHPFHRRDDAPHPAGEELRAGLAKLKTDLVGVTAITPAIYEAEEVLKIAEETVPAALRVLGGVHATFMFRQVLEEAPWIEVIVRGEGEEIIGGAGRERGRRWPLARRTTRRSGASPSATATRSSAPQAASTVKNLDAIDPDWSLMESGAATSTCPSA
ncbi:MAG: cobalamin-dependent protein [Desulfobacterales bacterium]|nr:cobalamin-dependent protein [Desulfobacterales bacterium]